VLANVATIIASQSIIEGAFSMTRQAISSLVAAADDQADLVEAWPELMSASSTGSDI